MIVVGVLGALVNVAAAWALSRAKRRSLNVEGARAHVLADLYGSIGAAAAGAVILLTGFLEADPIAALAVSALMFRSGGALLRDDCHQLRRELEGLLHERFGIDHTTLQTDHEQGGAPLQIAPAGPQEP